MNTTTPSTLILADVEGCVKTFRDEGEQLLDTAFRLTKKFRDALSKLPQVILMDQSGIAADPCKTIFKIKGLTGYELADHLD